MVREQSPGKTLGFCLFYQKSQPFKEILAVMIILKYRPTFDSACHNMMQGSGGIYACFARHAGKITSWKIFVKCKTKGRPQNYF